MYANPNPLTTTYGCGHAQVLVLKELCPICKPGAAPEAKSFSTWKFVLFILLIYLVVIGSLALFMFWYMIIRERKVWEEIATMVAAQKENTRAEKELRIRIIGALLGVAKG